MMMTSTAKMNSLPSHLSRSAIYLNNVGCSLLEKSCHGDAYKTLQDAVSVMRLTCSPKLCISPPADESAQCIESKLRQADRRLACPSYSPIYVPLTSFSADTQSPCFRSLIEFQEPPELAFHPIRIEVTEAEDLDKMGNDVMSAIVLYNFAISSICQAMSGPFSDDVAMSFYEAMDVISLANRILSHCKNPFQFLFISLVSYETMARALSVAGFDREAQIYQSILDGLKSTAEGLFRVERCGSREAACAA